MNAITSRTLIPVSVLTTLAGGVFWLSSMWFRQDASAQAIAEIKIQRKEDKEEWNERLNIMDRKLDRIIEMYERRR